MQARSDSERLARSNSVALHSSMSTLSNEFQMSASGSLIATTTVRSEGNVECKIFYSRLTIPIIQNAYSCERKQMDKIRS